MSSVTTLQDRRSPIHLIGECVLAFVNGIGDLTLFAGRMLGWLLAGPPRGSVIWPTLHEVGVRSLPVVLITGLFIGMVLAVQSYDQFVMMHLENRLGSVITISLVEELGPVLAAVMLAGRVGSAMAAELGTMRVTEQIDALRALGANPIHYLVVPRFIACLLLIPLLAVVADCVGMLGGWFFSTQVLGIDSFYYWFHAVNFVTGFDVVTGLVKSLFFGAAIAVVSCHRGFNCGAGAQGVGRAATEAFVYSFVAILVLDFFLSVASLELLLVLRAVAPWAVF